MIIKLARVLASANGQKWTLIFLLSLVWGLSYIFIDFALKEMSVVDLLFLRMVIASAALFIVLWFRNHKFPTRLKDWNHIAIMGVLSILLPLGFSFWGQKAVPAGTTAIIMAFTPFLGFVMAHFFVKGERAGVIRLTGSLIGTAGVAVVVGGFDIDNIEYDLMHVIYLLLAAFFGAAAAVYGKIFKRAKYSPAMLSLCQMIFLSVVMFPVELVFGSRMHLLDMSWLAVVSVLFLGLFCSAAAFVIYFRLLRLTGGTASIFLADFLIPIIAVMAGAVFIGEHFGLRHIIGIVLIGIGLAMASRSAGGGHHHLPVTHHWLPWRKR